MPGSSVPLHRPCPPAQVAAAIRHEVLAAGWPTAYHFFACREPVPELPGPRLTRAPFLEVCVAGACAVLPGPERAPVSIAAGSAMLFAPGTLANVAFPGACRLLRVTFDEALVVGSEDVAGPVRPRRDRPAGAVRACVLADALPTVAAGLLAGLLRRGAGTAPTAERDRDALRTLLWELVALLEGAAEIPRGPGDERAALIHFLREQAHRGWSRAEAAAALGLSAGHLGRLVKQATGRSYQEQLTAWRLEHARWLLRETGLSIAAVAARSGFASGNYFGQAFRRACGCSPREWRRSSA